MSTTEVQIRRRERESYLPNEVTNEAITYIGSHFVKRSILRGLDPEEERKYLPAILGLPADHPEFPLRAKDYWAEMSIKVPSGGVVLNVRTRDGEPDSLEDWLRYRWALRHTKVAASHKELMADPRKDFYIYDPEKESLDKNKEIELRKLADVEFVKASQDKKKMRRLMTLLSNSNVSKMTDVQVENQLYDIKNQDPERFYTVSVDKHMDQKAEVLEMIKHNILRKVGNQIIYIDRVIAEELDDAVAFFRDPTNSETVTMLRAKLKEMQQGDQASIGVMSASEPKPPSKPKQAQEPEPAELKDTPSASPDPVPAEHADKVKEVDDIETVL